MHVVNGYVKRKFFYCARRRSASLVSIHVYTYWANSPGTVPFNSTIVVYNVAVSGNVGP